MLAMNGNLDEMIREIYLGFPEEMKEQAPFDRVEGAFSPGLGLVSGAQKRLTGAVSGPDRRDQ